MGIGGVAGAQLDLLSVLNEGQDALQHIIDLGVSVMDMGADAVAGIKEELGKQSGRAEHPVRLDDVAVFQGAVSAPDIIPHLDALGFFSDDHKWFPPADKSLHAHYKGFLSGTQRSAAGKMRLSAQNRGNRPPRGAAAGANAPQRSAGVPVFLRIRLIFPGFFDRLATRKHRSGVYGER